MKTLVIVNPKGGSGKTTLATNVASALSNHGKKVIISDHDPQKSSFEWLDLRPEKYPVIYKMTSNFSARNKTGLKVKCDWLIIDTSAGISKRNFLHSFNLAYKVLIPMQTSIFDINSSKNFFQDFVLSNLSKDQIKKIGIVGMRVDSRTKAASTLHEFLKQVKIKYLSSLGDSQIYSNASFNGLGLYDLPNHLKNKEIDNWNKILRWLVI